MKNPQLPIRLALTLICMVAGCFVAQAQTRTFVSGSGSDANPCTRTAPCRTFQQAHNLVAAGGEVIAIDSAGYGTIVITKSVSIIGDGVYAGVSATSGFAITIATAGINVTLRNLLIEGLGTADRAIGASDFAVLHIENCIATGFTNTGIVLVPSGPGNRKVFIKDTIIRNTNAAGIGISNALGTSLLVSIEGTRMENNAVHGISALGAGLLITIRDCVSSRNTGNGLHVQDGAVMNIESCVVSQNSGVGIQSLNGSIARVLNSTITNNTGAGFVNGSATFQTRSNNTLTGNNGGGAQTSGVITPIGGI